MLPTAMNAYLSHSGSDLRYRESTTSSFRLSTLERKLPSPQAGSKNRESMRSVSCFTMSSMALTSRSFVKTSPCSWTRSFDLTCPATL
jgi:hypothetical protein